MKYIGALKTNADDAYNQTYTSKCQDNVNNVNENYA